MAKAKKKAKKRSYRQSCATDVANGNHSKFTAACKRRFPDLAKK